MWKVWKCPNVNIYDYANRIIHKKGEWFLIGKYNEIDTAAEVVKHEIYLHDSYGLEGTPKLKIENEIEEVIDF